MGQLYLKGNEWLSQHFLLILSSGLHLSASVTLCSHMWQPFPLPPPIKSLNMLITVILNPIPEICVVFCSLRQLFVLAFSIPYKFWPWSDIAFRVGTGMKGLSGRYVNLAKSWAVFNVHCSSRYQRLEFLKCPCSHLPDVSGFPPWACTLPLFTVIPCSYDVVLDGV